MTGGLNAIKKAQHSRCSRQLKVKSVAATAASNGMARKTTMLQTPMLLSSVLTIREDLILPTQNTQCTLVSISGLDSQGLSG